MLLQSTRRSNQLATGARLTFVQKLALSHLCIQAASENALPRKPRPPARATAAARAAPDAPAIGAPMTGTARPNAFMRRVLIILGCCDSMESDCVQACLDSEQLCEIGGRCFFSPFSFLCLSGSAAPDLPAHFQSRKRDGL